MGCRYRPRSARLRSGCRTFTPPLRELARLLVSDDRVERRLAGSVGRRDAGLPGQRRRHRRLDRVGDLLIGGAGLVPVTFVLLLLEGRVDDLLVRPGKRPIGVVGLVGWKAVLAGRLELVKGGPL